MLSVVLFSVLLSTVAFANLDPFSTEGSFQIAQLSGSTNPIPL